MEIILEVKNLTKIVGKNKILNNMSFNIEKGKIYGLVGKNGAGKSTLLKTIVGLYKPTSGSVCINGYSLEKDYEKAIESVGCMIEMPALYDYMTGEKNLNLFKKMFKGVDENRVKEIVKLVSLEGSIYKKLKFYSLGMRQRLGLATALINNPQLLILDEPTNGLDPIGIKDLREFLKNLKDTTIILSSHMLNEIENICDRVIFINDGTITGIEDINNLKTKKIKFEVDDKEKAKKLLSHYNFNEKLEIEIEKEDIPIINKTFVENNIKVFKICEVDTNLENKFLNNIGELDG